MAIQQRLHTKLVQKLILTPSLQQAIKLLPMSTIELADMLNQEVVENPMLEEVPTEELQVPDAVAQTDRGEEARRKSPRSVRTPGTTTTTPTSSATTSTTATAPAGRRSEVKELPPIENTLSTQGSLSGHLEWQLSMQTDDDKVREIGDAIIGNLGDDGYLMASVDEIAVDGRLVDPAKSNAC